ncbi:MAG: hypothetical protein OXI63_22020 [Candidatus Poribacteria bacterium]|nr:hypothetical protein [Candidatus Poribacteria bacterium]
MDAEIRHSDPINCVICGEAVRIKYVNDEYYALVQVNPIPGTEDKNPIAQSHNCKKDENP